jgi:hypothetical protein
MDTSSKKFLLQGEIAPFLREHGIPIGDSTVEKLCTPASVAEGKGPPVDFYWNRRPLEEARNRPDLGCWPPAPGASGCAAESRSPHHPLLATPPSKRATLGSPMSPACQTSFAKTKGLFHDECASFGRSATPRHRNSR